MKTDKVELAKKVGITKVLRYYGHRPTRQTSNELVYYSPFTDERTPSFMANVSKNLYYDFSSGLGGDVIHLTQNIKGLEFLEAIKEVLEIDGSIVDSLSFDVRQFSKREVSKRKIQVIDVKEVENLKLINYLSSRRIDLELARLWVKEVYYSVNGNTYYALGFMNDSGGFELRNPLGFKGKTKNGITTISSGNTKGITVFEGFFDFLSALMHFKREYPRYTTYILNSTVNYPVVLKKLSTDNIVYSFLDNDRAGENVIQSLISSGITVRNVSSELYSNHKDFNEFLIG